MSDSVKTRMRRLNLGIGALCMEMEKRGRMARYCEVASAYHGESPWNAPAMEAILKTLEELEAEKHAQT